MNYIGQKLLFPYEEHGQIIYLACEVKELLPNNWIRVDSELREFKGEAIEFIENGSVNSSVIPSEPVEA